jgi:integrase
VSNEGQWVTRWGIEIDPRPVRPGVWRRRGGGYLVRGEALDPRTGKRKDLRRVLFDVDAVGAETWLRAELKRIKSGQAAAPPKVRFKDYAPALLARKVSAGDIRSAATRGQWASALKVHLVPAFGDFYLDALRRADVMAWRDKMAAKVQAGDYSPHTVNDLLAVLRVVVTAYVVEYELDKNPTTGVPNLDASVRHTYTEEEPNALTPEELPRFLAALRKHYPQHFAMAALGFATGLRPSTLRPLRRAGRTPDVLWGEGALLVRRSQTRGDEVMETTKTRRHQRIALPPDLLEVLAEHADALKGKARESDLLFPSRTGGYRAPNVLEKPFARVAKWIGLSKKITPRAMRRTFQDLCRAAEVRDVVTRAVSGHATEDMQRHYSSVSGEEMREALGAVVSLAGFREARESPPGRGAGRRGA